MQELPFLDVLVIVRDYLTFSTDIYYKPTNSHFYLDYNSHHPEHIKNNIPFTLAKKINIFVSDPDQCNIRLSEMKTWLLRCNYPRKIVENGFFKAKLQGPAPKPKDAKETKEDMNNKIIFTTTYFNNFSHENTVQQIKGMLKSTNSVRINKVFENCSTMLAFKQPKNLLRHLTKASFVTTNEDRPNGLWTRFCKDVRCKLCAMYIQECTSFTTHSGMEWNIRSHITCQSLNTIYYLKCNFCPRKKITTYCGRTNILRLRMNDHICKSKSGKTDDIFDKHVFQCRKNHPRGEEEPSFQIFAFFTIKNTESLPVYEKFLHRLGVDSMNAPKKV